MNTLKNSLLKKDYPSIALRSPLHHSLDRFSQNKFNIYVAAHYPIPDILVALGYSF